MTTVASLVRPEAQGRECVCWGETLPGRAGGISPPSQAAGISSPLLEVRSGVWGWLCSHFPSWGASVPGPHLTGLVCSPPQSIPLNPWSPRLPSLSEGSHGLWGHKFKPILLRSHPPTSHHGSQSFRG